MSRLHSTDFHFPDPRKTLEDGLLCIGGDLRTETLYEAYSRGIFPWPQEGYPLLWFSPPERGVLDFAELHLSRRFKRFLRKTDFTVTFDREFEKVIRACSAQERPGQEGTWILPPMEQAYIDFHRAGYAHSVECWEGDELVGGLYGVFVAGVFSGESMFFKRSEASKLALYRLIQKLSAQGLTWMDIQMVTPGLQQLGGKYIERDEFLARIENADVSSIDFTTTVKGSPGR